MSYGAATRICLPTRAEKKRACPHAPPDPLHPHAPPPQSLSYQDLPKSLDLLAALAARSPGNESILQTLDYARKAGMMASVAMRPVSEIPGEGGERGGGGGPPRRKLRRFATPAEELKWVVTPLVTCPPPPSPSTLQASHTSHLPPPYSPL